MTKYWLAVVSHEHVRRGVELGIAQANHGKRAPVERMSPGDGIVYYSPREGMRAGAQVKAFTAVGTVDERAVWQAEPQDTDGCFRPWRRGVHYRRDAHPAAIETLRAELDLTAAPNWGVALRRGLLELSAHDFALISRAMLDEAA